MGVGLAIVVGVALVACSILLWASLRPRHKAAPVQRVSYRCVGIQPADPIRACEAVKALASERFLPGQAPPVPLPACTASHCACKYVHFDDRRSASRRGERGQQVRKLHTLDWAERRRDRGRRKTDRRGMLDEARMQAAVAEKRKRRTGKSVR